MSLLVSRRCVPSIALARVGCRARASRSFTRQSTDKMTDHNASLPTPPKCTADVCIVPIGTGSASVSNEVAMIQRFLKTTGAKYVMHSAGTTLDGSWDEVMKILGQCHSLLHANGVVRIQSDIRVGTRTDKVQGFEDKVTAVERLLAQDKQ